MSDLLLTRRSFLILAGGVVVLASCGSDDDRADSSSDTHPEHFTEVAPGIVSADLYVNEQPQRLAFVLLAKEGYASGQPVRIALAPSGADPARFVDATPRFEGLPEFRGVYTIAATLPTAGTWEGLLEYGGEKQSFAFNVRDAAAAPAIGDAAPRAASPTTSATLAVDPICTREPTCPLHERSLDAMIGQGRPVAVLFATPARCQTQYCGPVLDALLPLVDQYRERVDVVHVEIYQNSRTTDPVPTVAAWNLPSEPWFFGVDTAGKIVTRLDGAFDRVEMQEILEQLADQ